MDHPLMFCFPSILGALIEVAPSEQIRCLLHFWKDCSLGINIPEKRRTVVGYYSISVPLGDVTLETDSKVDC
jgi:hypothetical protein